MTQEFHLSITPIGQDHYLIRTEKVEPGVPLSEAQVHWPVEDWLKQVEQITQTPFGQLLQAIPSSAEDLENHVCR